jgi:hypothetical protein
MVMSPGPEKIEDICGGKVGKRNDTSMPCFFARFNYCIGKRE